MQMVDANRVAPLPAYPVGRLPAEEVLGSFGLQQKNGSQKKDQQSERESPPKAFPSLLFRCMHSEGISGKFSRSGMPVSVNTDQMKEMLNVGGKK
jgi:hypothetical protein